jgi:hypothetical protein
MKTNLVTTASKFLLFTLIAGLFAGCASTRPISDAALGAGGAYLGHELSDGSQEQSHTSEHDSKKRRRGTSDEVVVDAGLHGFEVVDSSQSRELERSVDLPAPDRPTMVMNSPSTISRLICRST